MNLVQKEILNSIVFTEKENPDTLKISILFKKDFIGFDGHFIEKPVLSGVCILETVKCILSKTFSKVFTINEVKTAKFYSIITAEEKIDIIITILDNTNDCDIPVKVLITGTDNNKKSFLKINLTAL